MYSLILTVFSEQLFVIKITAIILLFLATLLIVFSTKKLVQSR